MMLLTANLSLHSLRLLMVRGCPKLLTMWKTSFIWNDCRENLLFSERLSMLNASFVHDFNRFFTEQLLCASLAKEHPALRELKTLNSCFECCFGWNTGTLEGKTKMSNPGKASTKKQIQAEICQMNGIGKWGLRTLWEQGLVCLLHYGIKAEWMNEWMSG